MDQRWTKLGLLYTCDQLHPKLMSHAANPLPVHLRDDVYRVFYSARDQSQKSSVGAVDIDIITRQVMTEHTTPFFSYGPEDSFYSDGVSIGNTYEADGVTYMLFMGWKRPKEGHWFGEIGRLIVNQDFSLEIESEKPFMGLDETDPISLSYPWVLKDKHKYRMWYGSTVAWDAGNGEMLHVIKYAESLDGKSWTKIDHEVPHQLGKYQAFSRPTVVQDDSTYRIWFSCRSGDGSSYRIGTTSSSDGLTWNQGINLNAIELSPTGWDSDMVEYPFVFRHRGNSYMLFNGNEYGKTGFGLAILEE